MSAPRPTRRDALRLGASAAAMACGIAALPRPAAAARNAYDLTPRQVADGIWMIEGAREYFSVQNGGAIVNVALIETPTGLLLVDAGPSRRYGVALAEVARGIHPLGVTQVAITHHHPDHFFGAQVFADRPIRALGPTALMAAQNGDSYADALYRLLGDWMRGTEPTPPNSVLAPGPVDLGGRRFQALALSGHTAADLALLDERTGVLIAGDLAFLDRAPTTPDADIPAWRKALAQLSALRPAAVLPGHGPFDPARASLSQTDAYLEWLDARLRRAVETGLDMPELIAAGPPPPHAGLGAMPDEFARSVAHLYPGLEREILPRAN